MLPPPGCELLEGDSHVVITIIITLTSFSANCVTDVLATLHTLLELLMISIEEDVVLQEHFCHG